MRRPLLRFALVQIGWFSCVGGAAVGRPILGIVTVAAIAAAVLLASSNRSAKLAMLTAAGVAGYIADSLLTLAGGLDFAETAQLGGPTPLWMAALWVNLAVGLDAFPEVLGERPVFSAIVGALGGPLAYFAGEALGALSLPAPWSPLAVAAEWAIAMPVLFAMDRHSRPRLKPTESSATEASA